MPASLDRTVEADPVEPDEHADHRVAAARAAGPAWRGRAPGPARASPRRPRPAGTRPARSRGSRSGGRGSRSRPREARSRAGAHGPLAGRARARGPNLTTPLVNGRIFCSIATRMELFPVRTLPRARSGTRSRVVHVRRRALARAVAAGPRRDHRRDRVGACHRARAVAAVAARVAGHRLRSLAGVTFLGHETLHGGVVRGKRSRRSASSGWFGFLPFVVLGKPQPLRWPGTTASTTTTAARPASIPTCTRRSRSTRRSRAPASWPTTSASAATSYLSLGSLLMRLHPGRASRCCGRRASAGC